MEKMLSLLDQEFESSSGLTPQFAEFFKVFKREVNKELKRLGAVDISIRRGHFEMSGHFQLNGKWWYFSVSDVRYFPGDKMLIRTADGPKDYTGGPNQYIDWSPDMFERFLYGPG